MKVGPIQIEKEAEYQLWAVSLTVQNMSYYTRWYSSQLYTKQEAIEEFMKQTEPTVPTSKRYMIREAFERARVALLFLEISEME